MKAIAYLSALATLLFGAAWGCAADAPDPSEDEAVASSTVSQTIEVVSPSGAYFASITANGSGCPAGTWEAAISPDGQAFTVTFSAYETTLSPGQATSIADCALGIDVHTPSGTSFSVGEFFYQGYALLDQTGMRATQSARYSFQGAPLVARQNRSELQGPYDNAYLFSDRVSVNDLVWSPCGATRRLNAQTQLTLRNNAARTGSGYLNTTSVDGTIRTTFVIRLNWMSC